MRASTVTSKKDLNIQHYVMKNTFLTWYSAAVDDTNTKLSDIDLSPATSKNTAELTQRQYV